ncbi:MAG: hypothetical protein RIT25_927 [Planctomycetota bacterium]|jgi:DNA-directed RNA polymerase specialized sigma24 family protein
MAQPIPFDPEPLRRLAYHTAGKFLAPPVLAEEAGDQAIHLLVLQCLEGFAPRCPEAWIRVVAKRVAIGVRRSGWTRTLPLEEHLLATDPFAEAAHTRRDLLWDEVADGLTPRMREALWAARTHRLTCQAAAACGMRPRDFRRSLRSICKRARRVLETRRAAGTGEAMTHGR